ncbi:MAG TPA: response regulator [Flavisolibacter sp.]|nr:response regulator [Flavisolibacter sp.]
MHKLIVYVDDDSDDIELLKEAFQDVDTHKLRTFHSGSELYPFLEENGKGVCMIVLDINMPVESGMDILRKLRALPDYTRLPIALLSTTTQGSHKTEASFLGASLISKPVQYADIKLLPRQLIDYCEQYQRFE